MIRRFVRKLEWESDLIDVPEGFFSPIDASTTASPEKK